MKWITDLLVSIFTLGFILDRKPKKEISKEEDNDEAVEPNSNNTIKIAIAVVVIFVVSIVAGFAATAAINSDIYDHYIQQRETYTVKKPDPSKSEPKKIKSVLDIKD
jgi:flagellar basal body-associated protein FliL